jgi:hypothetical protein
MIRKSFVKNSIVGRITVALGYLNGSVTQVGNTDRYQITVKEPMSIKNKDTGKYEITHYNKYKLFAYKNKIHQSLLDYADFKDRQQNNISISLSFSGEIDKIYTKEDNPKVTEPMIIVSINGMNDFISINKEMMSVGKDAKKSNDDDLLDF